MNSNVPHAVGVIRAVLESTGADRATAVAHALDSARLLVDPGRSFGAVLHRTPDGGWTPAPRPLTHLERKALAWDASCARARSVAHAIERRLAGHAGPSGVRVDGDRVRVVLRVDGPLPWARWRAYLGVTAVGAGTRPHTVVGEGERGGVRVTVVAHGATSTPPRMAPPAEATPPTAAHAAPPRMAPRAEATPPTAAHAAPPRMAPRAEATPPTAAHAAPPRMAPRAEATPSTTAAPAATPPAATPVVATLRVAPAPAATPPAATSPAATRRVVPSPVAPPPAEPPPVAPPPTAIPLAAPALASSAPGPRARLFRLGGVTYDLALPQRDAQGDIWYFQGCRSHDGMPLMSLDGRSERCSLANLAVHLGPLSPVRAVTPDVVSADVRALPVPTGPSGLMCGPIGPVV
ncbi:BN159_2729 family protein [Streptomyces coerulescens]|uniref:BN159_2729 family protein n=1 Tax=Streptomyces coerulescens TaxID=29304 RepID=A0ABW0CLH5_STRCD